MKCPFNCGGEIVILPYFDEGIRKELWVHQETRDRCEFKDDGIQIHVLDPFLQGKFKEIINEGIAKKPFNRFLKKIKDIFKSERNKS